MLLRAGYIRQLSAGIYSYLFLAQRSLLKIQQIVREEMDAIGGQEMLLPALNPAEVWQESGRWDVMGDNMFRLKDRFGRDLCLGMTHEEVMTVIARGELRSYKQLPQIWYQIQTKFRDEPRPKSGLLRVRQFIMKDSYTFDMDQAGLDVAYDKHYKAYCRIFDRCGLEYTAVEAHSGAMGGSQSHEFMVASDAGEDFVAICKQLRLLGEPGEGRRRAGRRPPSPIPRAISRPRVPHARTQDHRRGRGVHGPARDLADEEPGAGGRRQAGAGAAARRSSAERDQVRRRRRAIPSSARRIPTRSASGSAPRPARSGPVGVDEHADPRRPGAGGPAQHDRRRQPATTTTCATSRPARISRPRSTTCARSPPATAARSCGGPLEVMKTVEIGHIFKLGYKYSDSMGLRVLNADGKEVTPIMGSYGIGIERILCRRDRAVSRQGRHDPAARDRAVPGGGHAGEQCRRRADGSGASRSIATAWRWVWTRCWTIATSGPA